MLVESPSVQRFHHRSLTDSYIFQQSTSPMSQTPSTTTAKTTASSRFQAIFDAALKSYQKQTKKDILTHPLASQLRTCDSTSAILSILQDQLRDFDESCSSDERLMKWLTPTVNVLCAFSAAVSGGVSLVSFGRGILHTCEASSDMYSLGIFACERNLCRHRYLRSGKYLSIATISWSGLTHFEYLTYRQPRMLQRAKMFSQSFSNALDSFSSG